MKPIFKTISIGVAILGGGAITLSAVCYAAGARVNTTKSIPVGLYWTSSKPIEKGAYVMFCPSQTWVFEEAKQRGYIAAGFCPGNYGYMMKKVMATTDDTVSVTQTGVAVNGSLLPLSVPINNDLEGRPLPRFQSDTFVIGNSEVLLMSDVSSTSFDGRYFGPVNRSQIKSVIVPVITW